MQELYRHDPGQVASLILADTYAGWRGSLPADEVDLRVADARRMLAAPTGSLDPTLPGLFAGEPPAEFVRRWRPSLPMSGERPCQPNWT